MLGAPPAPFSKKKSSPFFFFFFAVQRLRKASHVSVLPRWKTALWQALCSVCRRDTTQPLAAPAGTYSGVGSGWPSCSLGAGSKLQALSLYLDGERPHIEPMPLKATDRFLIFAAETWVCPAV